ncbi:hypothetical protein ACTFIV_002904 [Dictyostelium citrinum]
MFKKSKKQYRIIIIIIICFLNICKSSSNNQNVDKEIILKIDFSSIIDYENAQCGGSINEEDSKIYPPCKTFYDAGERSRQLFENNSQFNQVSLVLIILNLDPNKAPPTISLIGEKTFGDLINYCSFDIDFQDTNGTRIQENYIKKNPLLIIDGKSVSRSFIKYVGFENNTLCNKKLISINNLLFKDWASTLVFSNSLLNKPYHSLDFYFSSITTIGSFKFIESVEANYTEGDLPANFIFKDCHFTNVTNIYQTPLFYMYYNNVSLEDTVIDNMKLVYSPFFLTMSTFVMENSIVNNVELISNDDLPIVNMNGFVIQFYNSQFTNNKISTFFKGYFPKRPSQPRDPNIFRNCLFNNNNIISTSPNSFIMISLFQIMDSIYLSFENTLFSNNTVNSDKTFLSIDKSYQIKFKNSTIPNQFSSAIIMDNGFIDLKANSRINSKTTIKGINNLITIDQESSSHLNLDIFKKDCLKCNYIVSSKENSDTSYDALSTKNYKIHSIDKDDLIKKIIIPVLVCSITISILVLVVIFRKNIKLYFTNHYANNNNNNTNRNNSINNNVDGLSDNIIEYEYGESIEGLFSNQTSCDNPYTCPSTSSHIDHISVFDKNNDTPELDNNV